MYNPLFITLTGGLIGILSGMFGFGGSSISTPLLRTLFLIPPYYALATPLPMAFVSSSIATFKFHKNKLIDWKIALTLLPVIIIGSVFGAYLTKFINGKILMVLTAVFLIYMSIKIVLPHSLQKTYNKKLFPPLGFLIGFVSGLLANGGGILVVPILVMMGICLKKAIGTSMVIVLLGVTPSLIVHAYLGHIDWIISLLLIIGATPLSYVGAHITVGINKNLLRKLYGGFLLLFSTYFLLFEFVH